MANMNLITGYYGENHVTSDDAGTANAAMFGAGQYVMDIGSMFSATVVTNNKITINDGVLFMQGRQARIEPGTTVDLTIDNGAVGYNRNDLIVARYTRDASSGVEQVALVVLKGTSSTETATDPDYVTADLINGSPSQNDMPLYRIPISGINAGSPVQLFSTAQGTLQHIQNQQNPHHVTADQVGAAASAHAHRLDDLSNVHISASTPTSLINGDWYLVKES